jgi:midasin
MLTKCSNTIEQDSPGEKDGFLREDHQLLRDFTRLLNLDVVLEHVDKSFRRLPAHPEADLQRNLGRFLPFLDRYMYLVEEQLTAHAQWLKALLKLDYVLCSVMHTLAKEGFCKPVDTDESGSGGETSEAIGGVGLGEGSGSENVSKEIEDESQVEGLQDDEAEGNDPKGNADDDNTIEMAEDFGGDMEDVPEARSDQGNESDQEDQPDVEEQIEHLDATDPSAVDEKLWGDDEGPEDEGKVDKKTSEDRSQGKERDSEVVAKEDKPQAKQDSKNKEAKDDGTPADAGDDESMVEDTPDNECEEHPDVNGAPMDDLVQDANTLDLPDDLDLGFGEGMEDEMGGDKNDDMTDEDEDGMDEDDQPETLTDQRDFPESLDGVDEPMSDQDKGHERHAQEIGDDDDATEEDKSDGHTVAHPDISTGEGVPSADDVDDADQGENMSPGQAGGSEGAAGQDKPSQTQMNDKERCVSNLFLTDASSDI